MTPGVLAAVSRPLRDTNRAYAEGVAESLVEELLKTQVQVAADETVEVAGRFVEPVQLQVACESLWRELPSDVSVIQPSHLQTFGDVDRALSRFYESSIRTAAREVGVKPGSLRKWFERILITPAGTRGTVFRGAEETGGITNAAVDVLEDVHLIRPEVRAGAGWYELTHDRFIEPIQGSNQIYARRRRRRLLIASTITSILMVAVTMAMVLVVTTTGGGASYESTFLLNPGAMITLGFNVPEAARGVVATVVWQGTDGEMLVTIRQPDGKSQSLSVDRSPGR